MKHRTDHGTERSERIEMSGEAFFIFKIEFKGLSQGLAVPSNEGLDEARNPIKIHFYIFHFEFWILT